MNASRSGKKATKYDDVDWHVGGEFPADLDARAARIHMGMFLLWAVRRGLESQLLRDLYPGQVQALRDGKLMGSQAIQECCDDKLTSDDLSSLGNEFAQAYYESTYLDDYVDLSDDALPSIYHEPDTLQKYARIEATLDKRLQSWKDDNGVV